MAPEVCAGCLEALSDRADRICTASASAIAGTKLTVEATYARILKSRALLANTAERLEQHGMRRCSTLTPEVEIEVLGRLHQMTLRFLHQPSVTALVEDALEALMRVTAAPLGNVQLLNCATGMLTIAAHQGFRSDFLDFFAEVSTHGSACGVALRDQRRVIVGDVAGDPAFTPESRRVMLAADARAVQSTPLVSMSGKVVGIVSTHYHEPRVVQTRALRIVDLYARQIATLVECASSLSSGADQASAADHERLLR